MEQKLHEIINLLHPHVTVGGSKSVYPNYSVFWSSNATCPVTTLYEPMLCLVLQGEKEVTVGEQVFRYTPGDFFINSIELPIATQIIQASQDAPYISLSITLDPDKLAQVITESGMDKREPAQRECFVLSKASDDLLAPLSRLFELLDTPDDAAFLAPMIERELLYRLLQSDQQEILRQITGNDYRVNKIRDVINWVKEHYAESMSIKGLTEQAGMSQASLHRHFRSATGMTPLQFQKTIRLQEARKLLVEGKDVSETAYAVGYESPSQFSREYSRLYGIAPSVDAKRLQARGVTRQEISHAPW
ncbi:AraC family transcriptional regulator [Vibrio sp. AK197]